MRQVAILGGCDWADASIDHLSVPDELDLNEACATHREWVRDVYGQSYRPGGLRNVMYIDFVTWLRTRYGAVDGTVEEFEAT